MSTETMNVPVTVVVIPLLMAAVKYITAWLEAKTEELKEDAA